ncbi:conserved membrane hypothetical protein [Gammaproteobacteria bacterium]
MNELQFLSWVRGTGLQIAVTFFLMGMTWRLIEIYTLGRKVSLAESRHVSGASGWHTIYRRFLPPKGMFQSSPITYAGGYVFHIGLAVVFFLFAPHIKLIQDITGFSWSALPSRIIDMVTVITLAAMVVVIADRIKCPTKRFLSGFSEYFAWIITFLPVLTGYLAANHLLFPYTSMFALHILSVELLLIMIPFTNLVHVATVWPSRWFNGDVNGHRGVPV